VTAFALPPLPTLPIRRGVLWRCGIPPQAPERRGVTGIVAAAGAVTATGPAVSGKHRRCRWTLNGTLNTRMCVSDCPTAVRGSAWVIAPCSAATVCPAIFTVKSYSSMRSRSLPVSVAHLITVVPANSQPRSTPG
jgi:hypothetical protein